MKDSLKMILSGIPKYASNLISIGTSPHESIKALIRQDDDHLTNAWTFFAISLVITEFIRFSGKIGEKDFFSLLISDSVWKIIIFFICSILIYIILKIITNRALLRPILATSVYFYSIANVGWNSFVFIIKSIQAGLPCERINKEYSSFIDCQAATQLEFGSIKIWEFLLKITEWSVSVAGVLGLVWLLYAWFIWSKIFDISKLRSFSALLIFMFILPIIFALAIVLRFNTFGI